MDKKEIIQGFVDFYNINKGLLQTDREIRELDIIVYLQSLEQPEKKECNIVKYLENELNPEYMNSVFTWKQIIDALQKD
jgi:hypothetical protein